MYSVSDEYKEAIAQLDCEFMLTVRIYLRDKTILSLGEDDFPDNSRFFRSDRYVKGDLKIESQMMSGSASSNMIDIGAVPSKKLDMTIYSPTTDLHVFSGAWLLVIVSVKRADGVWEPIPMGRFFINGASISREGNWVSFTAYDGMLRLQYEITTSMRNQLKGKTALEAARILCSGHIYFAEPKNPFGEEVTLPNSDLPLDFDSEQIETARDAIMWIAQLMGCFARVNRAGNLEFVQIKSWWKMYTETTGTILAVRNIQGDARFSTKFSDDRIHIVGVSMRGTDNKLVTARYNYTHESGEDPTSDITVELETNPLVMSSEKPLYEILESILAELSTAYFYSFSAQINNDPALDAGDTVRLQGGTINGTNRNNDLIGFITHSTWIYKKKQTITNASSVPIAYENTAAETSAAMMMSEDGSTPAKARAASPDDNPNYLPPKPQSEKALQGKNDATRLVGNFGGKYVLKWDSPMGLKAYDHKGKEVMELRIHPDSDQLILESGKNKVKFVQDSMWIKHDKVGIEIINGTQFYIYDKNNHPVLWISPEFGIMKFSNSAHPSGFEVNVNSGEIKMNGQVLFTPLIKS